MIEWLRRDALPPTIAVAGRALPIAVRRHPRARRLTLRLAPDGSEVRLTIPRWCSEGEAVAFAHARADWLGAQAARLPARAHPVPGGTLHLRGDPLTIDWQPAAGRTPRIEPGRISGVAW